MINVDWARLVIHNLAEIIMLCIITINNALSIRYVDDEKSLAYLHSAVQYRYRMPAVAVSEHFNIPTKRPSPSSSPDLSAFSVFRLRLSRYRLTQVLQGLYLMRVLPNSIGGRQRQSETTAKSIILRRFAFLIHAFPPLAFSLLLLAFRDDLPGAVHQLK